jgi:hypothetical protein
MDATQQIEKHEFDFFPQDFNQYSDADMLSFGFAASPSNLTFNALNISTQVPEFYPQTIAPSALTSSPKGLGYRSAGRASSPEEFLNIPRDSSSSPSSSDAFHPLPSVTASHIPTSILNPAMVPLHHLAHSNLSSASLSRSDAEGSPTVVGRGLRESPRVRARSPEPKPSPKRNGGGLVDRHQRARASSGSVLVPPARAARRGSRKVKEEEDWTEFDEDDDFAPAAINGEKPERRREDIRRQRIESEQRRRDELREGYNRLRAALPPSNQKSSKASILERATVCITDLNHKTTTLGGRVDELEAELRRVRVLNETLMLSAAEHRTAAAAAQYAAAQAGVHLPAHNMSAVGFQQA